MTNNPECKNCHDMFWVCEEHPDHPWDGSDMHDCCGAAGMPCPQCNTDDLNPKMLPGSTVVWSAKDGWAN